MIGTIKYGLILIAVLALLPNFPPMLDNIDRVKVVVEFNSAPAELSLLYLKILGYDFEVIDTLNNVMNGAVISIDATQIDGLKDEGMVSNVYDEKFLKTNLDKSVKLINADDITIKDSNGNGLTGKGVRIAVVDTGIDYSHPDLFGFGTGGKVVGGYDFLENDDSPMDTDGHGTLVAGIIAANGQVKGVASNAELVAYRIASEGTYVSTADMIRALDRAVEDEIDVLNISLGLDYVSEEIDSAIEKLVGKGVVVVTAAGNNGESRTIGSPASAPSAISVGASYNNVTMSAVATLKINGDNTEYYIVPMVGSPIPAKPVTGKLVFGKFANFDDFMNVDAKGAIVLAERGGSVLQNINGVEKELPLYFTDKEMNAARNGAVAIIIYNNVPGIYFGTLINENAPPHYSPRIPVVSISMEEGLMLKELLEKDDITVELNLFYNPDVVAPFSSRGPVSPFYLKPTLVAPGAFINSTTLGGSYNVTSGTSFAAPHATGAVALLLQKHPDLNPNEVTSLLATTAKPVNDAYGLLYSFDSAGAGRLDVNAMLKSNIIATPYYAILHLSAGKELSKIIELRSMNGALGKLAVSTDWNEPVPLDVHIENVDEHTAKLIVDAKLPDPITGKYEGKVNVESEQGIISIPVIVYADEAAVDATNKDGRIWLSIDSQENWKFAKVKIKQANNGQSYSVTLTPSNNLLSVPARSVGEYWIEANLITKYGDIKGFSVLYVNDTSTDGLFYDYLNMYGIPIKEALMIGAFLGIASIVVYVWTKRKDSERYTAENLFNL
jgi:minor extracellular serine protease Vpr